MQGRVDGREPCCWRYVWDYHFDPQTNVIDVHISRLAFQDRQGFERLRCFTPIRGAGYMIRDGIR